MRILIVITYCLLSATAMATDTDTTALFEHRGLWHGLQAENRVNPAAMGSAYRTDYTELYAYANSRQSQYAALYEMGRGDSYFGASADTYLHLGNGQTVWGGASYRTGKRRAVNFCSTADYMLLYPYVTGDTVGGNLNSERYTFSGGYAISLKRLTLGADINFRAEHEYRTRDPRPRSIVTSLQVNVGATCQFGNYDLGAFVGGNFYKQTNNVTFYSENGADVEYHFTGLASDFKRFAGLDDACYYKATGYAVGLTLCGREHCGAYATVKHEYMPYKKILTDLNALPLVSLYATTLSANGGYVFQLNRLALNAYAGYSEQRRSGDETIAGNSSATEYDVVGRLTMFHAKQRDLHAGVAATLNSASSNYTVSLSGGYIDYKSDYVYPNRNLELGKYYAQLQAEMLTALNGELTLTAGINGKAVFCATDKLSLPYTQMLPTMVSYANHNYQSLTADRWIVSPRLRLDIRRTSWGSYGAFIALAADYGKLASDNTLKGVEIKMGITF